MSTLVEDDDEDLRSNGNLNSPVELMAIELSQDDSINPPIITSDSIPKIETEPEELGQFIELNEISLIGRDDQACPKTETYQLQQVGLDHFHLTPKLRDSLIIPSSLIDHPSIPLDLLPFE